ncbi:unnamed protein product, partial [Rotaria sp. Silwood1]
MAALSRFGLDQLMDKITFVCDRGSNLIKALEDYQVNQNNDQFNWNNSNDDDDDCLTYYDDRDSSGSETDDNIVLDEKSVELALRSLSSSPERDHVNVNWHPKLEALRKPTIKQAIIVRWLTMSQLLESILSSYSALTSIASVVFFKRHARQLLKAMFSLHDLHWIAAILNPHTRMLKHATDVERAHAYCLVRARLAKLMKMAQIDNNEEVLSPATISLTPPPHKKLKSYTTQFHDDTDLGETSNNMIIEKRAHRELEIYLQLNLTNCKCLNDDIDNLLLFWKEQEHVLPNMSRLAKQIFSIPAFSAAVERAFSSA